MWSLALWPLWGHSRPVASALRGREGTFGGRSCVLVTEAKLLAVPHPDPWEPSPGPGWPMGGGYSCRDMEPQEAGASFGAPPGVDGNMIVSHAILLLALCQTHLLTGQTLPTSWDVSK